MPYSLSVSAPALIWAVKDPLRIGRQPQSARRARRRGLSKTVSRVERSAEHRSSLNALHALATRFRQGLDATQSEQWLMLEEALLAHTERSSRTYYNAGFRCGVEWSARSRAARSQVARRLPSAGACSAARGAGAEAASVIRVEVEAAIAAGADCLAALARLLLAASKR